MGHNEAQLLCIYVGRVVFQRKFTCLKGGGEGMNRLAEGGRVEKEEEAFPPAAAGRNETQFLCAYVLHVARACVCRGICSFFFQPTH